MRRPLLISFALAASLLVSARSACAGLDLTWNACNLGPGAASDLTPGCASATPARLFGSFQMPSDFDFVSDMFATLEVRSASGVLPSFWQMAAAGCNANAIQVSHVKPATECPSPPFVSPWPGSVYQEWSYTPDPLDPGHATLNLHLYHVVRQPYGLHAGVNYFAFLVTFSTARASQAGGPCAGCADPVVLVWTSARFVKLTGNMTTLTGPGLVSQCATLNGAAPGVCAATPARRLTWGAIKSLYR
jgi:hypothetical protein